MDRKFFLSQTQLDAITAVAWVLIAIVVGVAVQRLLFRLLARWAKRSDVPFATSVVRRVSRSAAYVFPLLAILIVSPLLDLPPAWTQPAVHLTGLLTIAAIAWAVIVFVRVYGDVVVARHRLDVEDNLLARQLGTRVDILARVVVTIVVLVALGAELMTFPSIRALGTTLLASAGVAGIAVGLAARPLFENLVAGVQLALTQPIRIDDVVIVEKQYGHIEEIHSTYIVVRLWDLRRGGVRGLRGYYESIRLPAAVHRRRAPFGFTARAAAPKGRRSAAGSPGFRNRGVFLLVRCLRACPGSRTPPGPGASRLLDTPGVAFRLSERRRRPGR